MVAAQQIQDFNALELANTLWAMAKTGTQLPDAFGALRMAAAQNAREPRLKGLRTRSGPWP